PSSSFPSSSSIPFGPLCRREDTHASGLASQQVHCCLFLGQDDEYKTSPTSRRDRTATPEPNQPRRVRFSLNDATAASAGSPRHRRFRSMNSTICCGPTRWPIYLDLVAEADLQ